MCKLYFKVLSFYLVFCCVINLFRCLGAESGAGAVAGGGAGAGAEAEAGAGAGAGTDKNLAGRLTLACIWCSGGYMPSGDF